MRMVYNKIRPGHKMRNQELDYFLTTFPPFLLKKIKNILLHPDHNHIFTLHPLVRQFQKLFQNVVRTKQFHKTIADVLQVSIGEVNQILEQDQFQIKALKQNLYLYMYKQVHLEEEKNHSWETDKKVIEKLLWKIRLQFQFSSVGQSDTYIGNLLSSIEISDCCKLVKEKFREILKGNEYDSEKFLPETPHISGIPQIKVERIKSKECFQQELRCHKVVQQRTTKKIVHEKPSQRIIQYFPKKQPQGRTLYMSHPMKFKQKRKQNVHVLYDYVEKEQSLIA